MNTNYDKLETFKKNMLGVLRRHAANGEIHIGVFDYRKKDCCAGFNTVDELEKWLADNGRFIRHVEQLPIPCYWRINLFKKEAS